MIDINELRQLAQGANEHSDDRAEILAEFYAATQSDTIIEILDRLEAAEKERVLDEQRIADLMTELNRVGHENDKLRAEVKDRNEVIALLQNELRTYKERERAVGWNNG